MGELYRLEFKARSKERRSKTDIADTPTGQAVIRKLAFPVFQRAIEQANDPSGPDADVINIDLNGGEWSVEPLSDPDDTAS